MSRQAFGILPKIREVDQLITPDLQQVVYEAHPELAFLALTGNPIPFNKKTAVGRETRLRALSKIPTEPLRNVRSALRQGLKTFKRSQVAPDDLLDACVLVWTAYRILNAQADRVPTHTQIDRHGLRMEIWY
jgi:predicted RNase H-like nuclease